MINIYTYILSEEQCEVFNTLPVFEEKLSHDVKSTLVYIAGYVPRKDHKTVDRILQVCFVFFIFVYTLIVDNSRYNILMYFCQF